jgi:hypothetical protein
MKGDRDCLPTGLDLAGGAAAALEFAVLELMHYPADASALGSRLLCHSFTPTCF